MEAVVPRTIEILSMACHRSDKVIFWILKTPKNITNNFSKQVWLNFICRCLFDHSYHWKSRNYVLMWNRQIPILPRDNLRITVTCFIFQNVPNQVPLKARLWQGWPLSSAWQDFEHQSLGSKTHCAPNKVFYWPWKWPSAKRTGVVSTIDQSLKTTKKIEQRFFARVLLMASVSCEAKQTNSSEGSWFESNSRSFIGLLSSMEANIFATIPKVK